MAKITLNSDTTAALQEIIGNAYHIPVGSDIVTGDKGDETVTVQYDYRAGDAIATMFVISPDAVYVKIGCSLTADNTQIATRCEVDSAQATGEVRHTPADHDATLAFIAAIDMTEIKHMHRGALNPDKVTEFQTMMGVK